MVHFIQRYFQRTTSYSTLRFIVELTVVSFILKIIVGITVGIIIALFFPHYQIPTQAIGSDIQQKKTRLSALIEAIVLAPLIETLIGQVIPIVIIQRFTKKIIIPILVSSIIFAGLHEEPFLIASIFPLAVMLAWSFTLKKKRSGLEGYFTTVAIHALHNAAAAALILLPIS